MNIADFGGFAGIAKMITQIKETSKVFIGLAESTGVTQIAELKTKYMDALDKFRPGNTDGVASIAGDFENDYAGVIIAVRSKIQDKTQATEVEKTLNQHADIIRNMLNMVVNALKKAS